MSLYRYVVTFEVTGTVLAEDEDHVTDTARDDAYLKLSHGVYASITDYIEVEEVKP